MGDLLSSITGQLAVRSIALGTFFPVVMFAGLDILLVAPLLDPESASAYIHRLATGEDKWGTVVLGLLIVAITGILYSLNMPILRVYEGYPWEKSYVGSLFKQRKARKLRKAQALQTSLRALRRGLLDPKDPLAAEALEARIQLAFLLNSAYPDREDLVLPTRLGNLIRNFERYPSLAYDMDAIVLWPRFVSNIDTNTAAALDDAKTSLDFMLNSSFLGLVSAAGVTAIGLSSPLPLTAASVIPWLWRAALFLALFAVFYELSLPRAAAWGAHVKSVFDVYRFDLLTSLGYAAKPESMTEERALWHAISQHLLFSFIRRPDETLPPYSAPSLRVQTPAGLRTELLRTIAAGDGAKLQVSISAANVDPNRPQSGAITIVDTLPKGFRFVAGTAAASKGSCEVVDVDPLTLRIASLALNETATVTYTAEPVPTEKAAAK